MLQKLLKQLQRYELEEPLGLENKQTLLWWKECELLYKTFQEVFVHYGY